MSRRAIAIVRCDSDNCDSHVETQGHWLQDAVREARRAGWQTGRFGDYCPEHLAEGEGLSMDALTPIEQSLLKELLLKMRPRA